MATIVNFEDLEIWQLSRKIAKEINEVIKNNKAFFSDKKFCDQIKSASGSVMDNIAEGFERGGRVEFKQFCSIAKASAGETRSQIYRGFDYGYFTKAETDYFLKELELLSKKINAFINYLINSPIKGRKYKE